MGIQVVERKKKGTVEGNLGIVYYILNIVDRVSGSLTSGYKWIRVSGFGVGWVVFIGLGLMVLNWTKLGRLGLVVVVFVSNKDQR